jgi:hypothetical protein
LPADKSRGGDKVEHWKRFRRAFDNSTRGKFLRHLGMREFPQRALLVAA